MSRSMMLYTLLTDDEISCTHCCRVAHIWNAWWQDTDLIHCSSGNAVVIYQFIKILLIALFSSGGAEPHYLSTNSNTVSSVKMTRENWTLPLLCHKSLFSVCPSSYRIINNVYSSACLQEFPENCTAFTLVKIQDQKAWAEPRVSC